MKKSMLLALGVLMSIYAWSYDNVDAAITWTVGNEKAATVVSDAAEGVNEVKMVAASGLTVGTYTNYAANPDKTMTTFQPAESKKGNDASVMVEYRVKMKKGTTFTLTNISYDAIKEGTNDASCSWSYAVDGKESDITTLSADDLLRNDNSNKDKAQLNHTHAITATAGQTVTLRVYVSGFANNKKLALSNIVLTGKVNGEIIPRTFTNFKVDFRSQDPTWVEPKSKPANVELSGLNYKDTQHGLQGGTITVQVDGPVKFTLGGCGYGKTIEVKKGTEALASIDNKSAGCDDTGIGNYKKFTTWTYNVEEAATLSFTVNGYLPYMFAEACDFVPQVEVRYYDTDGKKLIGSETVAGGSELKYKYGAADVTVADGKKFRGWYNSTGTTATKVKEGLGLTEDLTLYAKATDIEVTALGKTFDYDFRLNYFYPEDHEMLSLNGGKYKDTQHGWVFSNGNSLGIQVAGNALLSVGVCTYSETGTVEVKDAKGNKVGELKVEKQVTADGAEQQIFYEGDATTLTFAFTATNYIHRIKVYNVSALPKKDASTGYYILAPGDGAGLKLVLESLKDGDKVFLPNGVYDFGEDVLTQISKSNISIIGQSMEGTIIKNAPDFHNEGIGSTATLLITGNNTYLQDLTLENDLDYFTALAVMNNGRGVALQDKGTKTICKNVRLLSNQDTYYSNKVGALKYFEDCEIHGTVDFICGDGSVYFKNNELVGKQRNKNGGGANAITASNADASDKGYIFESCRVRYAENIEGTKPVMSLGRSWNNAPKCVFLNTELADDLTMTKDASAQKDKIQRWTLGAMNALPELLGEYHSVNKAGLVVSPESNNVKFVLGSNEKEMNTIITAEQAATYTMAYTLGDWAATAAADATQAVCEKEATDFEANAIYMAEAEGEDVILFKGSEFFDKVAKYNGVDYKIRKANARGGFGKAANESTQTSIPSISVDKARKVLRNGQLIIIRDGKEYNAVGAQL